MPTKRQVDSRTDEEKAASREESTKFKEEMEVLLKGTKFRLAVNDEAFFGSNSRYRITLRNLSKEEAQEIVEAVAALNLVAKWISWERITARPHLFRDTIMRLSASPNVEYRELTAKVEDV
jgi:hypothetical protein